MEGGVPIDQPPQSRLPPQLHYISLIAAHVCSVPLHLYMMFLAMVFLSDAHRRSRMGIPGVVHLVASSCALVTSWQLTVPLMMGHPAARGSESVTLANGLATLVSNLSSLGLLWMLPAPSKKFARLFACSIATTTGESLLQIATVIQDHITIGNTSTLISMLSVTIPVIAFPFSVIGTVMVFLNYADQWIAFGARSAGTDITIFYEEPSLHHQSSFKQYGLTERMFCRAFLRTCTWKLVTRDLQRQHSGLDSSPHGALIVTGFQGFLWCSLASGELTGVLGYVIVFFQMCMYGMDYTFKELIPGFWSTPGATTAFNAIAYNLYACVTFGMTLLLKGKLSQKGFYVFFFLALSGVAGYLVPYGPFLLILINVGSYSLGALVAATSYILAKEKMSSNINSEAAAEEEKSK